MSYDKNPDGTYTDLAYTKFPAKVDSWQDSQNLTANYLSLANDYKTALLNGNYSAAQSILNANPELKRMLIGADDINKLKHSQMAIERLFTEDIEEYIKSYTDKSTSEADKATTSAANAAISEKNALNSETAAAAKASEANELVENLKTLKGTLPSDFTEYTQQIADAKEEFDNKIDKHNTSDTAHQDIRDDLEKISSNVYSKTEADAKFGTPYTLPPATADQLGGVKVGDYLDIAADGTLSGKTLYDTIAASVAVKSEARLVWNTHVTSPNKFTTWDVQIPDNVDKICITKGRNSSSGNNTEESIARGGTTTYDCNYDFTITFQTNGILHVANSYKTLYPLELWIDGYHYPTIAELLTETQAAQADTDALAVDQEYRVALLELGLTDDTTTDTRTT
jgi:hypothetical protein